MKFTPTYLKKNKGQKVRLASKQRKKNSRENEETHLASLNKGQLEKRHGLIILEIYMMIGYFAHTY
jgi:hypothetical protein